MPHINFQKLSLSLPERPRELSQDIPNHVLQRASRLFSDPTQEMREMSKDWTSVEEYPFIWTKLIFRESKTSTDTICHVLQNAPMLECLELIKVPRVETVLRQLCRCRHQLKHLSIRFCHSGEDCERMVSIPEATFRYIIQCCPHLSSLDIEGTPFHGRLFYEELLNLRRLRSLRLGCSSLLRSSNIQAVAAACRGRLTHFCLTQCPEGPPQPVSISTHTLPASRQEWKAEGRAFREFSMPVSMGPLPLTSADCALLLRMLGPKLRVLELDIAGVDLWALQGLLVYCTGLRCLCLLNAKIVSGELVRDMSSAMLQLTHLLLRGAPLLGDKDLAGFLERGGPVDGEASGGASTSDPDCQEATREGPQGPEEKEWWEWGFWSDHEEDDSDGEEDPAIKNAASEPELDVEEYISGMKTFRAGMNTLDVGMCSFITDELLHALSQSPAARQLRRLGLRGCQLVTDLGLGALLGTCTKLKHLDVSFIGGGHGPGPCWLASVGNGGLPELTSLVVGWQKGSDDGGQRKSALAKLSAGCKCLRVKRRLSRFSSRMVVIS